ncbi:unnamed protein product [Rhodiola kirilowii]
MASVVNEGRNDKGKLPSQTIINPRQNVSVIVIKDEEEMKAEEKEEKEQDWGWDWDSASVQHADVSTIKARTPEDLLQNKETSADNIIETCAEKSVSNFEILNSNPIAQLPFPMQVIESHEALNNDIQPKGNEDARTKARMKELEQGKEGALTTRTRDPGAFTVTCGIGNTLIPHCLIDLGASINVMPYDLYCSLKLGPMENTHTKESPTLILGRPILFAMKAEIDVGEGTIKLKYDGEVAEFCIFEDDRQPSAGKPPEIAGKTCVDITITESLRMIQGVSEQLRVTKKTHPPDKKRVRKRKCGVGARKRWTPKEKNWRSKPPDGGWSIEKRLACGSAEERSTLSGKYDLEQPWDPNL